MRVKFYLERRRGEITTVVDWLLFSPFDICICHDKYQNYKYKKKSAGKSAIVTGAKILGGRAGRRQVGN